MALLLLSHSRLLGIMYRRIGPAPAKPMPDKFPMGTVMADIRAATLLAQPWTRSFPAANETLAVFVSPQCQSCNGLMPHLMDFGLSHGDRVDLVLLSVLGDYGLNQAYVKFAGIDRLLYLVANELAEEFNVPATPYALLLDRDGRILAKGIVNNYEHLLSLTVPTRSS
jgi:methylamine dehydrogenase accessory protein MauD